MPSLLSQYIYVHFRFIIYVSTSVKNATYKWTYCHVIEWLQKGFKLVIEFIEYLQNLTTNNYTSLTEFHAPKITVTMTHIKSSQSSQVVAQ
jgi:hypothetical protein